MTYAIDTHASIKRLADAGVPNNQAEALVELMAQQHEDVATKADIAALNDKITTLQSNMATKADLAEVKADIAEMKTGLAEMKTHLLISMITLGGVMIAAIKLF